MSVWDWDKFGRNKFLGEVRFPLGSKNLTDSRDLWYNLQEKVRETSIIVARLNLITIDVVLILYSASREVGSNGVVCVRYILNIFHSVYQLRTCEQIMINYQLKIQSMYIAVFLKHKDFWLLQNW